MIGNELKVYDGLTPRQQLNLFRNLYYNDGNATEYGIIANAINDCLTADVVPKSEVAREVIEIINDRIDNIRARIPYGGRAQGKTLAVEKMRLLERLKVEIAKKYPEERE